MDNSGPKKRPKAVIWFDSFGTTGPMAVTDRLAQALEARGVEVVIAGSDRSLMHNFAAQARTEPIRPHFSLFKPQVNQSHDLKKILDKEQPDMFITEHFPFIEKDGLGEDILKAVKYAREKYPKMAIYGVPRDVPVSWKDVGWASRAGAEYLDAILVRGDRKVADFDRFLAPEDRTALNGKMHYVGYTIPPKSPTGKNSGGGIVVHLGGGRAEWDLDTYREILRSIPQLPPELQQQEWHFYFADTMHPDTYKALLKEYEALPDALRAHVHAPEDQHGFIGALQAADMVVARGGITAVEAVAYGKPAVLLPLHDEQNIRVEGLTKLAPGRVTVIEGGHPGEKEKVHYDPAALRSGIEAMFAQRRVKAPPSTIAIDGHNAAAQGMLDRMHGIESSFDGRRK